MSRGRKGLTDSQKAKVREIVAKNALRKGSQAKAIELIEKEINVTLTQSYISKLLSEIQAEWLASSQRDIAVIKAEEIAELDALKADVYDQWERSKLNAESISTETVGVNEKDLEQLKELDSNRFDDDPRDPDKDLKELKIEVKTKETKKSAGQYGDPQLVNNLIKISERKSKLLGMDAPVKQEINLSMLEPPKPLSEMTNAELAEYRAKLQSFKRTS